MANVYRETFTKPLPSGAEIFVRNGKRFARWKDAKGKVRTAPVTLGQDGSERITVQAETYTAKYRDAKNKPCKVATGCRDETNAKQVLAELLKRVERVKALMLTPAEDAMIDYRSQTLAEQITAYLTYLESRNTSPVHRENVERCLKVLAADCKFTRLSDLRREPLENWLVQQAKVRKTPEREEIRPKSARTRNFYRAAMVAFCNWCVATERLLVNPFTRVAKADEKSDPRRHRRALTEEELGRLLVVARLRPLAEYGRSTIKLEGPDDEGKRSGWTYAPLTYGDLELATAKARERIATHPPKIAELEAIGQERAMIYKTLVLTGLRKGELASLTVGQLHLDGPRPYAELNAADEKNRQGSHIPLRRDLADDLVVFLVEKGNRISRGPAASEGQMCLPMTATTNVPADAPVFVVPDGLIRILNRDLAVAGIPKKDERGRTVDVHALRHSFGTLLSKGGVAPRTAQAAMRHSSIDLTMNTYTDPKLLDVHGALDALPELPLSADPSRQAIDAKATGTDDFGPSPLVPTLVPPADVRGDLLPFAAKSADGEKTADRRQSGDVSDCGDKQKQPRSSSDYGCHRERRTGFEPATSSLGS